MQTIQMQIIMVSYKFCTLLRLFFFLFCIQRRIMLSIHSKKYVPSNMVVHILYELG